MTGVALVTGASRGIGASIARALARDGFGIGVNYARNSEAAEKVVSDIVAAGGTAVPVQADVADPEAVEAMFSLVTEHLGAVSVLVNNAGITDDGLLLRMNGILSWRRIFAPCTCAPRPRSSRWSERSPGASST